MRLVAFDKNGTAVLGVHRDAEVIDLSLAAPALPKTLRAMLEAGPAALQQAASAADQASAEMRRPYADLTFHVPIPDPSKIICLGLNYADHAKEGGHNKPEYPSFFMRGPASLLAHGQAIMRPLFSDTLDYEAELMAIVGQRAKNVKADDALAVIAGYSIFNDGSVREYQRKTSQWTIGKNFDATGGFGPEFVTSDELPAGAKGLRIQSRLNGQVMQDAITDDMLFGVIETIVILTACLTLEPGDLIAMGTPGGVGHARKPPVFMRAGDVCEIEIEQIGVLRNPIQDATA